jgi:DNA-binding XRE family transcriptional regulator
MMGTVFDFDVREIRRELGVSQAEFAALVGVSKRSIQSYEQKWRQPSEMVQRALLLIVIARRNGGELTARRCWEHKECAPEVRRQCIAYVTRQGHLCWFLTGTLCEGQRMNTWGAKWDKCLKCDFCRSLLAGACREGQLALDGLAARND